MCWSRFVKTKSEAIFLISFEAEIAFYVRCSHVQWFLSGWLNARAEVMSSSRNSPFDLKLNAHATRHMDLRLIFPSESFNLPPIKFFLFRFKCSLHISLVSLPMPQHPHYATPVFSCLWINRINHLSRNNQNEFNYHERWLRGRCIVWDCLTTSPHWLTFHEINKQTIWVSNLFPGINLRPNALRHHLDQLCT